jgi:hypothetical protein
VLSDDQKHCLNAMNLPVWQAYIAEEAQPLQQEGTACALWQSTYGLIWVFYPASLDEVAAQQKLYQALCAACQAQLLSHAALEDLQARAQEAWGDPVHFASWLPQAVHACLFLGDALGVHPRLQAAMPALCFSCPSVEAMLGEPALKRVAWSTLKGMLARMKGRALEVNRPV